MNMITKSIENKVVVITGGTRGIGFATAQLFLDSGAKVALCGSRSETTEKALNQLKEINPEYEVLGFYPNLLDTKDIEKMIDEVVNTWGTIDILINNAGISDNKSIYDYDDNHFAKIMNINVEAVFNCSKLVANIMRKNHSGVILNTSSVVSLYGQTVGVGYPTSKFAINGLTKSLARELGKDGIRVNAVAPGIIETDMVAALDQDMINRMAAGIPVGRIGKSEDIANAFLFLASDMASYISGSVLSVDGAIII